LSAPDPSAFFFLLFPAGLIGGGRFGAYH